MKFLRSFPLLFIPMVIYNMVAFISSWSLKDFEKCNKMAGDRVHPITCQLAKPLINVPMATAFYDEDEDEEPESETDGAKTSVEDKGKDGTKPKDGKKKRDGVAGTKASGEKKGASGVKDTGSSSESHKPGVKEIDARKETSGRFHMVVNGGDIILVIALLLLFAEVLSATSAQSSSIVNHAFSLIVLIIGIVEFLTFPQFATSVFLLITLMALLDVLAGFIVTIASVRRDVSFVSN